MCTTTSPTMPTQSTWAASVPVGLTESITAAVGPQPVPTPMYARPNPCQPRTQLADTTGLHEPAPMLEQQQQGNVRPDSRSSSDLTNTLQWYPTRRPTLVELQAAGPAAAQGLQNGDAHSEVAAPAPARFDAMDDLELPPPGMQQPFAASELERSCDGSVIQPLPDVDAAMDTAAHPRAAQLTQQEQQQILNQLWSELQAQPTSPAGAKAVVHKSHAASAVPACTLLCAKPGSGNISTGSSVQSSSSLCSSDQVALAMPASAPGPAPAAPESPCSSSDSKALSTCSSSSSKKRVSWGDDIVHLLPPDQPPSVLSVLWDRICSWRADKVEVLEDSNWSPAFSTTAVVVSVAAGAALAVFVAARRAK